MMARAAAVQVLAGWAFNHFLWMCSGQCVVNRSETGVVSNPCLLLSIDTVLPAPAFVLFSGCVSVGTKVADEAGLRIINDFSGTKERRMPGSPGILRFVLSADDVIKTVCRQNRHNSAF